jgi:hypothetical protein
MHYRRRTAISFVAGVLNCSAATAAGVQQTRQITAATIIHKKAPHRVQGKETTRSPAD